MRFLAGLLVLVVAVACGSARPAPVGSPLGEAQLKFAVMDAAGKPVWCDPDFYPIARQDEQALAIARYEEIRKDSATYAAVVAHEHLPAGDLTDAQKLALYRAWKLLRPVALTKSGSDQYAFEYTIMAGASGYEKVGGKVRVDGVVTIDSRTATGHPACPICLAASTRIATPRGPVRVTDVRLGTIVWTQAADGSRVAAPVVAVGNMDAPAGHLMVHVVLVDGRELLVSPGHMTADGRAFGAVAPGDALDGSAVKSMTLVPYAADQTYDLLPAGATGRYWADGILLASTLG
jgi:hypothetical protein